MAILVTGGAGYIGSHTVVELLNHNYDVVILDNLSNSSADIIQKIELISKKKVTYYWGDVLDFTILEKIFSTNEITDVIHFAGLKSVAESIDKPLEYYRNNVSGVLAIIHLMQRHGVLNFIFSSSATVYGEPESIPLTESCRIGGTTNPYGTSKYIAELILTDIAKANPKLHITLLRYFNPVGAHSSGLIGESPKGIPNNLVPYLTRVANGKLECLSVFGKDYPTKDGTGVRDFIHVMDLASGHIAAIRHRNKKNNLQIYNLGTGKGYSVLELINVFERVTGASVNYEFCERRPGDIAECWSDPALAERDLHWKAVRTLDDMMADVWAWEKNNITKC
ncbi:TPA: UDP-glucose 4-epimerase GalE [Citrobacter amalonaticus]|uniref:UDP-glucose 4-epimerase GalE n=1 Tax=Citrobacter amalonaticus TaxID=35703 RepID=UPI00388F6D90|nr:UDP-glucose 4-epimerase GalE [Citrobacter amalonaticus]HCB3268448.1 UDP-glucose 4-epimerase GalE [Citrobacter amalonaticus]